MARCRVSDHRNIDRKYLYDKENGDTIGAEKYVNKKLNSILQRVDEIEMFKAATKEYVEVSRTVIANLRHCSLLLTEGVKAAEEAILESERETASFQSKIDSCFLPIRSHDHQSVGVRKKTNGVKGSRWCRNAENKLSRNASKKYISAIENQSISSMNLVENEMANPENCASIIVPKSKTGLEVANPDYRPIDVKSLKSRFKGPVSDSKFRSDCIENLDKYSRNVSRKSRNEEMRFKPSSEIDFLSLRKINRYDTSSDNAEYEAYNKYSVNKTAYCSDLKEKCNQFRHKLDKYKLWKLEIDDLSSRKAYRNPDINSSLSSDDDTDMRSTEAVIDSSETDEEFSKNSKFLLSLNQTENSTKECHENLKLESPLQNASTLVQSRNTSVPTNRRRDSKLVRAELNQLPEGSSDNYSDRHILLSHKEFSEFNDIRTPSQQIGNLNIKSNDNWFDAVESLRELSLQSKSSKKFVKQSDENYIKRIALEDKMVTSNHLSSKKFQTLCEIDKCSDSTAKFDSLCNNWNGETVTVNSTNPHFKEINEEFKFNESLHQSFTEVSSISENEENSNYSSINSSCSDNKTVYLSFPRETLTEHLAGEKNHVFNMYSTPCSYLKTPPEDTTDTSVYDYSSDAQQGYKLSASARKSSDISILNESSDAQQMKSSSDMSFVEISSNTSMYENSNSFQFRSDSDEKSSPSNVYASSFSMSKELSSLSETDLSYAAFREGLPTESSGSSSNEQSSYNTSQKVNTRISQAPESRDLMTEFNEVLTNDVSGYPPDCKAVKRSDEDDVLISVSNETPYDKTNQVSSETENKLQKSGSLEMPENAATNEETISCNHLLFVKWESSWTREIDMTKCAFRRAESYEKMEKVSDHIYSKRIRDFINNYHCIL